MKTTQHARKNGEQGAGIGIIGKLNHCPKRAGRPLLYGKGRIMEYLDFLLEDGTVGIQGLKPGLNFTVRYGSKWRSKIDPGDFVKVPNGVAQITHLISCKFADIPEIVFEREHDPQCATMDGLMAVLCGCYDDIRDATSEEILEMQATCIGFKPYMKYGW